MARMSEEQWSDLKFKITIGVILLIVGFAVYSIGPGLDSLYLKRARTHKAEPWAPKWFYNVGRIYEATGRMPKALETYKEFYFNYCGDEKQLPGIEVAFEATEWGNTENYALVPQWAGGSRPSWVGGEGAKPHPMMADVLMRLSRHEEDQRNYPQARLYYMMVLENFPAGSPAYVQAEAAKKRDVARGF